MQSKHINRNYTYSSELKFQAVKCYLNAKSSNSICEKLKFQDPKRIYVWTKAYQEKGKLAFIDGRGKQATGRSKYYKWKKSKPKPAQTRDKVLYQLILEVLEASKRTYGVQQIKALS